MKKNPKVSVLMATYNGLPYLHEQMESILKQTYANLEILVQDDGSTDGTLDALDAYAESDDRIRVFRNRKNLGINGNFFDLIEKSSGDYIAISDQDDLWLERKIELLLASIGKASLVYTDSELIDAAGQPYNTTILQWLRVKPKEGRFLMNLFEENSVSGHGCMFDAMLKPILRSSIENGHGEHGVYDQLIATIASFQNGIVYVDPPMTLHRMHGHNNCNNFFQDDGRPVDAESMPQRRVLFGSREYTPKKRSGERLPFWKRKMRRVRLKILKARQLRERIEWIYEVALPGNLSPFVYTGASQNRIERKVFSPRLFHSLRKSGIKREDALLMSCGAPLFYLFRFF